MRIPGMPMLHRLLFSPSPIFGDRPIPLHDPSPDPGLFGPDSVTWRVLREPILLMLGGRGLLMQAANPLVAQGAIDHSAYATDPYGRLMRTIEWVTVVTFGTTAEARAASRHVNRLHHSVSGRLPRGHGTRRLPAGTSYRAMDPQLLRWVHATLVDNIVTSHDALIGTLSAGDRDRLVREWDPVARLMGVPRRLLWRDWADLRAYVAAGINSGVAMPGAGSRLVSRTVLAPPMPLPLRPAFEAVAFLNAGMLPRALREAYHIRWSPAHSAAHAAACLWFRTSAPLVPKRLRTTPVHTLALSRCQGRWPVRTAA